MTGFRSARPRHARFRAGWQWIALILALLGLTLTACAPSGPSTAEVIDLLETRVNEQDLEGVIELFAEDAIWIDSEDRSFEGIENIRFNWEVYFFSPVTSEFRDISVDGDSATFNWFEFRPPITKIWITHVEVRNGKITRIEWPEDAERVQGVEQ